MTPSAYWASGEERQACPVPNKHGVRVSIWPKAKIMPFYLFEDLQWPLEKQSTPENVKWCCFGQIALFTGALLTSKSPGCGFCELRVSTGFRRTGGFFLPPDACGGGEQTGGPTMRHFPLVLNVWFYLMKVISSLILGTGVRHPVLGSSWGLEIDRLGSQAWVCWYFHIYMFITFLTQKLGLMFKSWRP